MAYIFKRSIIICVPPEQVYDELVDIASHKEWGEISELELLFEGPAQIDSRWRSSGKTSNFVMQDESTITEMERPRQFSFQVKSRSQMGTGHILLGYRLEPVPEGTLVTWSRENLSTQEISPIMKIIISTPGLPQLMDRLITSRIVDRGLANLRARLESKAV